MNSTLVKNTFFSSLTNALQSLANVMIVVLLARPLGAGEFGRLMLAISFVNIFAIAVDYGLRWHANKQVSQHPGSARQVAGEVFNAQLLLALAATLLAVLAALILAYPPRTLLVIAILWVSAVLVSINQATRAVFRGLGMFDRDAALNLVLVAVLTLALVPPLLLRPTVVAFAVAILAARTVYFAAAQVQLRRSVGRLGFRFHLRSGGRMLAATLPYGAHYMVSRLLLEWNTIVLHQYRGNVGVGHYQAAFRFLLGTMLIGDTLQQAFFPLIAQTAAGDRPRFLRACRVLNRYLLAIGAYVAAAFLLFAAELIAVIFGAPYAPAVPILKIFALGVILCFASMAPSIVLIAVERQGKRAHAIVLVLAFNALAAWILVPRLGAQGAAIAMTASFALLAMLYLAAALRSVRSLLLDRRLPLAGLLLAAGSLAVWRLKAVSLGLGIAGFAALGVLLLLAVATGSEKQELLRALRQAAGRSSPLEP